MKRAHILFWISLFVFYSSCSQQDSTGSRYERISNDQLIDLVKSGDVLLVDVRTPAETSRGTIEGAMKIDFLGTDFETEVKKLDKTKPLVVYCHSGGRSAKASEKIMSLGFVMIYDLEGGFSGWEAQGLPIAE